MLKLINKGNKMKVNKLVTTSLYLGIIASLAACNNGASDNTATNNNQSANKSSTVLETSSHDNNIDFSNIIIKSYKEISHGITGGQPWKSVDSYSSRLKVDAGRKGSYDTMKWAAQHQYAVLSSTDSNWGMLGTLTFAYPGDSNTYACTFMMLQSGSINKSHNTAIIYSNLYRSSSERAYYGNSKYATKLLCNNVNTGQQVVFTIQGTGYSNFSIYAPDYNIFAESMLSTDSMTNGIVTAFNSMPEATKKYDFAHNLYNLGSNPDSKVSLFYGTPIATSDIINQNMTSSTVDPAETSYTKSDTLTQGVGNFCNTSELNQNVSSYSYTYSYSTTTSTSTTVGYEVGGEVGFEFKLWWEGSKITTKVNGKYSHQAGQSVSNTQSYSVTAPSQQVMVPPHKHIIVVSELSTMSVNGYFNFNNQITNNSLTIGSSGDNLYAFTNEGYDSYMGSIPAVDALKYALKNKSAILPKQFAYNESDDSVMLKGKVKFNSFNNAYDLTVRTYQTDDYVTQESNPCNTAYAANNTVEQVDPNWKLVDSYSIPLNSTPNNN